MRYILATIIGAFFFLQTENTMAQDPPKDQIEVIVEGLGCPYCAFGLESHFKKQIAISKLEIDIETGVATFDYPASAKLTAERIAKEVKAAGYTAIKSTIQRANGEVEVVEHVKK